MDGVIISPEEEDRGRRFLKGKITAEESLAEIDEKLKVRKV